MTLIKTAVLGFPRIGSDRQLKRALEGYWSGKRSGLELDAVARGIRRANLEAAARSGVDTLPSNDFSLYDHVLDTAVMVGAIPERFAGPGPVSHERYFALARGSDSAPPLDMTKWLDTNYHYLVPELHREATFRLDASKPLHEFREALDDGIRTRPVILGPVSFLLLSKQPGGNRGPLALLDSLLPVYEELLCALADAGATQVQIDEPCLVLDRTETDIVAVERAWARMAGVRSELELTLATYFGGLGPWLERLLALPAAEFHLDIVRDPGQLDLAVRALQPSARLSLGVIDGRNVWVTDLTELVTRIVPAVTRLGEDRVTLAPSCSLLHVPHSAERETGIDPGVRAWLAFGEEKLRELEIVKRALVADEPARRELLAANRESVASRRASTLTNNPAVERRVASIGPQDVERRSTYAVRSARQNTALSLPELPTTTIGSFPQTQEIREMRRRVRSGHAAPAEYESFLRDQIRQVVELQDAIGLDVLVHGEAERNDMVEYFAENLAGFAISDHGWVQSYGSRCVKPPILFGDIECETAITVRWWQHAQGFTDKPVKGMLTGPVTMLKWSFVRDDQPQEVTCKQLSLAVRDETLDLERAGARVIQIDEPALREGLPLRATDQERYLRWAVDCFRLAANGVKDATQLHTHMCYAAFNEILEHIARMDADVISIEASRSQMDLLEAFQDFQYPNAIGPGVYDIHSPRVPSTEEIEQLIRRAEQRIARDRLWVNPDCGLKTRGWDEAMPALRNLVEAARRRRAASLTPA